MDIMNITNKRAVAAALLSVQGMPKSGALTAFCIQAACARAEAQGQATATVRSTGAVATRARMVRKEWGWFLYSVAVEGLPPLDVPVPRAGPAFFNAGTGLPGRRA